MLHFWLLALSVVGTAAFGSPAALSPALRPALRSTVARPLVMAAPLEEEVFDEEEFLTEEEYEAEQEAEMSSEAQTVRHGAHGVAIVVLRRPVRARTALLPTRIHDVHR